MNKNEIFNHYSDIIDTLIAKTSYFKYFFQYPESLDDDIFSEEYGVPANVSIRFGATRACIIDNDYNYVIKLDIAGDCENDSICQHEVNIYEDACKNHFDHYLTPVSYVGTYSKTFHFYTYTDIIQVVIIPYNMSFTTDLFEEKLQEAEEKGYLRPSMKKEITIEVPLFAYDFAKKYKFSYANIKVPKNNSPLCERNELIAQEFIYQYGEDVYNNFSTFLRKWHINDLHFSNVGNVNGTFRIIDYGGYHGPCDLEYEEEIF